MLYPFNREDLPFRTLTGIVDSDSFFHEFEANHPFYIKKGFSGIIPKGTPFMQMIPIKRDYWESKFEKFDEKTNILKKEIKKNFFGYYKKNFWNKKEFR